MRLLISSLDGLYGGFFRRNIGVRNPPLQPEYGGESIAMSDGVRIFETATRELRFMHNEGNLRALGKVSGDYYWAEQEIEKLQQQLAATLEQETITGDIFYNQGFSDGISFIMQSLMWEAVRR
jgi:uncharacterized protein (DUF2164 family)